MEAVEAPGGGVFEGDLAFGAGQVEGRGGAASGGLDLDQALGAGGVEAADVVAGAVAAFLAGPFDAAGQIGTVGGDQAGALVVEDLFLAQQAQRAVAVVAGGGIVFADEAGEALRGRVARRAGRRGLGEGEGLDLSVSAGEGGGGFGDTPESLRVRMAPSTTSWSPSPIKGEESERVIRQHLAVGAQVTVNGVEDGGLVVGQGTIAADRRQAEFGGDGRDVHVLELDRAMAAARLLHQGAGAVRLDEGLSGGVEGEHGEIVGHDGIELVGAPVCSGLCWAGHGVS